ncbi:MAG TPA: tetratricopeptide repeat protein [Bryobacteraceae bacterium]|jgi:tetratricopeptide (TPR) repeat protein|nr:tetratricopeptide repeat protein [Bryobacteraceae bacterium]
MRRLKALLRTRFRPCATCLLLVLPLGAQTLDECRNLRRHGKLAEAQTCYTKLSTNPNPYLRAEGLWGIERYDDANVQFRDLVKQFPKNADYRVRWGHLFFERFNNEEAHNLFEEALKIDDKNAQAYLGIAQVETEGFSKHAVEAAQKAADLDPKLYQAHEQLAFLALEDNDEETAAKQADLALAISGEALDAMAIHLAIDSLHDKTSSPWADRILKVNPAYGEAYSTVGHFYVINRRYKEGIQAYRRAIELNPRIWEAHAQLGVNLMRLGLDGEARQQLEECYNANYKSYETVNSLRLLDKYKDFVTFETPTTILRLEKKEAELLRPYIEDEMKRDIAAYNEKYQMKLKGPLQVEVYPDHEDFAVRTMGMPGLGALGVTFDAVIAMDSPSGRPPGSFHWASTLRHEMSHAYVLEATGSRVPRWFTEGLAVYEETAAAPDWGDRLDPEAIHAIQHKLLLPVAELDRGFIRPSYPSQVIVSYFQGGKICSYIAEKWGYSKLLDMIHAYAKLESTPDVFQKVLNISTTDFDQEFLAWLNAQTKVTIEHFDEWREKLKTMVADERAKKYDDVIKTGTLIRDWYPDYVETGSVYELLADAYTAKDDKDNARKQLEKYNDVGGRDPKLVERLATLEEQAGDPKKAAAALDRLNYIYPEDQELHKRLGDLWLAQNNVSGAIREYQALLALKPLDQATSHYQLAEALRKANRLDQARDEVLLALEAAPGYKPAQKLLLEIAK